MISQELNIHLAVSPSTFARETLLYAQEVGYIEADQSYCDYSLNHLDSFLILYVAYGTGILQYETNHYPLETGNLLVIDCQKYYKYYTTGKDGWHMLYLYFNGNQARGYYNLITKRALPICSFEDSKITQALFWSILDLHKKNDAFAERLTSLHITKILTDISIHADNHEVLAVEYPQHVTRIFNYIDRYYFEKISLDILATKWSVNKFHLARLFKRYSGTTINEFLITKRINKAKELLCHTDKTIDKIAEEVGFNNSSYFSYTFHKREHVTARAYRNQWKR